MEELSSQIKGYHYTNPQAYQAMHDGSVYRKRGLIPIKRFANLGISGLPSEAYDGAIGALLEPEPQSQRENPEFPYLWRTLIHDICREKEVMLLSFDLKPDDKAYVVERAHLERELYREGTTRTLSEAYKKYWDSRVPVFNYDGIYSVPELAIFSPLECSRLNVEWVKPTADVWQKVLDHGC